MQCVWAAGLMTGCGAPEPEDEGTTVKTETAKAHRDTLKAEEEGTADTSGSVDGGTVSPQDYKVGLMIPGNLGDKSFFDASFRSIEPTGAAGRGCGLR